MKRLVLGAAVAIAMVSASAANAVIFTQIVNFNAAIPGTNTGTPALNKFSTAGYTLNSVKLTWTPTLTGTARLVSTSGNNRDATSTVSVTTLLSTSSSAFTTFTNTVASAPIITNLNGKVTVNQAIGGTATSTVTSATPSTIAAFTGAGTIPLLMTVQNLVFTSAITNGGQGNFTASFLPSSNVSGILTVDYDATATAPFPEPATWLMFIIGFGFIGSGLRNRRDKQAGIAA